MPSTVNELSSSPLKSESSFSMRTKGMRMNLKSKYQNIDDNLKIIETSSKYLYLSIILIKYVFNYNNLGSLNIGLDRSKFQSQTEITSSVINLENFSQEDIK